MSSNFVQVSAQGGTGGRTQTLVPGPATQLFQFAPSGLFGSIEGGDLAYAERVRVRVTGQLTSLGGGSKPTPNWQQLAQAFGKVRVFCDEFQEMVALDHNTVPLLCNHDAFFSNGFGPNTRKRATQYGSVTTDVRPIEFEFDIPWDRAYGVREQDSCPWLAFLDGGAIEFELRASNALAAYGWTMTGNWTAEVVIDWFADKQALIHTPIVSRLYKVTTAGPEYTITKVGGARGYDGVVPGCRLPILSWLGAGASSTGGAHDNGFYGPAGAVGGGLLFGTAGVNRMDVPWRTQKSVNAVSAWISSFLADTRPTRFKANFSAGASETDNDLCGWPNAMDPLLTNTQQSLIGDALDFWPLQWVTRGQKISDMQKADGDLTFSVDLTTPPGGPIVNLFRTDEVLAFSRPKVLDIMDRMGRRHIDRGGQFDYVTKYAGARAANDTTSWGMPLKIVQVR